MTAHEAVQYRPDEADRHTVPAEVCAGCSDIPAGRLVPSSFCPTLRATGRTAEFEDSDADELWRMRYMGMSDEEISERLRRDDERRESTGR